MRTTTRFFEKLLALGVSLLDQLEATPPKAFTDVCNASNGYFGALCVKKKNQWGNLLCKNYEDEFFLPPNEKTCLQLATHYFEQRETDITVDTPTYDTYQHLQNTLAKVDWMCGPECQSHGADAGPYPLLDDYYIKHIRNQTDDPIVGSFLVIGDWGNDSAGGAPSWIHPVQISIAEQMAQVQKDLSSEKFKKINCGITHWEQCDGSLKFILAIGDNFYMAGIDSFNFNTDCPFTFDGYANFYHKFLLEVPWYLTYGNHDSDQCGSLCYSPNKESAYTDDETECRQVLYDFTKLSCSDRPTGKTVTYTYDTMPQWIFPAMNYTTDTIDIRKLANDGLQPVPEGGTNSTN